MKSFRPSSPPFRRYKREVFEKAGKAGFIVYQIGELGGLRKPSKEIPLNKIKTSEYQAKLKFLKNCFRKYRKLTGMGRGITAIQVGISERFSVIFTPDEKYLVIINPKITKKSTKKYLYPEMCMSANPIIAPLARPAWIEFEYLDETGSKIFWNTKDETDAGRMLNRVFQHEIDHMEGIINIDYLKGKDLIIESDPKFYRNAKFEEV